MMIKGMHQKAMSTGVGLSLGLMTSLLITAMILTITAKMIQTETIREESVGVGIMAALLLGSFGGAATGAGAIQRRKGIICLCSGLLYWGALLALTALFFGGQYRSVGVSALLIFAGSGVAALMMAREKKSKRRKNIVAKW